MSTKPFVNWSRSTEPIFFHLMMRSRLRKRSVELVRQLLENFAGKSIFFYFETTFLFEGSEKTD
jgi:hypothetical protein